MPRSRVPGTGPPWQQLATASCWWWAAQTPQTGGWTTRGCLTWSGACYNPPLRLKACAWARRSQGFLGLASSRHTVVTGLHRAAFGSCLHAHTHALHACAAWPVLRGAWSEVKVAGAKPRARCCTALFPLNDRVLMFGGDTYGGCWGQHTAGMHHKAGLASAPSRCPVTACLCTLAVTCCCACNFWLLVWLCWW
jgi:hypothetical protein